MSKVDGLLAGCNRVFLVLLAYSFYIIMSRLNLMYPNSQAMNSLLDVQASSRRYSPSASALDASQMSSAKIPSLLRLAGLAGLISLLFFLGRFLGVFNDERIGTKHGKTQPEGRELLSKFRCSI